MIVIERGRVGRPRLMNVYEAITAAGWDACAGTLFKMVISASPGLLGSFSLQLHRFIIYFFTASIYKSAWNLWEALAGPGSSGNEAWFTPLARSPTAAAGEWGGVWGGRVCPLLSLKVA